LTDFDEISGDEAHGTGYATEHFKITIFKIQDGGRHHLEKSKNRHISATNRPMLMKFARMTRIWCLERTTCCEFKFLKIHDGGSCHFVNR